jgi:hypothetical protein
VPTIQHRVAFYDDDVIMFIKLAGQDIQVIKGIFDVFLGASGLGCNLAKSQLTPIRYLEDQVAVVCSIFPCPIVEFPIRYLGVPLSVTKLP